MTTSDHRRRTDSLDAVADADTGPDRAGTPAGGGDPGATARRSEWAEQPRHDTADTPRVPRSGTPGRFVTTAEAPRTAPDDGAPRTAPDDGAPRPVVAVGPGPAAPTRSAPPAPAAPSAAERTGERTGAGKAEAQDRTRPGVRPGAGPAGTADGVGALLPPDLTQQLTHRLDHAVGTFVDDPRQAVQEADEALDETVRRLTDGLRERRTALHDTWHADTTGEDRGAAGGASRTEDLRLLLREYRDLVQHLLAV
ncbi:hypothetical protein [Kitasatospora terrestris]|uniref:Uncharacterized protein n=1 Tax=Kitasatospora terrestris TaxID=258051 RepID=A0ABP9DGK0_9ACTN